MKSLNIQESMPKSSSVKWAFPVDQLLKHLFLGGQFACECASTESNTDVGNFFFLNCFAPSISFLAADLFSHCNWKPEIILLKSIPRKHWITIMEIFWHCPFKWQGGIILFSCVLKELENFSSKDKYCVQKRRATLGKVPG